MGNEVRAMIDISTLTHHIALHATRFLLVPYPSFLYSPLFTVITAGPAAYNLKQAGVGPQALSTTTNSPNYGFGTADRDDRAKVQQPDLMTGMIDSPGPANYQIARALRGPMGSTFGTDERKGPASRHDLYKPGPGAYNGSSSLERQNSSKNRSCASTKFGTSSRPALGVDVG